MREIESTASEQLRYRHEFVSFIEAVDWHWMVTIGIGSCPKDEELLRRLRLIEAQLCGKYLSNSYHKLLDVDRYSMLVGFEGERSIGTRHAHILAYVPTPTRSQMPRSLAIMRFKWEFWSYWLKLNGKAGAQQSPYQLSYELFPWEMDSSEHETTKKYGEDLPVKIDRAGSDRVKKYYPVKRVHADDVPWSDVQFVTPPKFKKFENVNTKKIHSLNRSVRLKLKRYERELARL